MKLCNWFFNLLDEYYWERFNGTVENKQKKLPETNLDWKVSHLYLNFYLYLQLAISSLLDHTVMQDVPLLFILDSWFLLLGSNLHYS